MTFEESIQAMAKFLQSPEGEEALIKLLTTSSDLADVKVSLYLKTMSDHFFSNGATDWDPMGLAHHLLNLKKEFNWVWSESVDKP